MTGPTTKSTMRKIEYAKDKKNQIIKRKSLGSRELKHATFV